MDDSSESTKLAIMIPILTFFPQKMNAKALLKAEKNIEEQPWRGTLTRRAEAGILRCRELVRSADQICLTFVFSRLFLYFWVSLYADSHF
jgi:hypothetical protein